MPSYRLKSDKVETRRLSADFNRLHTAFTRAAYTFTLIVASVCNHYSLLVSDC
jgi:hypothetical protein